jgi:hypothetical protein
MPEPSKSEVAYFRTQQALQEEATWLALSGLAYTTPHAYINARIERIASLMEERQQQVGQDQAIQEAWMAMSALCEELSGEVPR